MCGMRPVSTAVFFSIDLHQRQVAKDCVCDTTKRGDSDLDVALRVVISATAGAAPHPPNTPAAQSEWSSSTNPEGPPSGFFSVKVMYAPAMRRGGSRRNLGTRRCPLWVCPL